MSRLITISGILITILALSIVGIYYAKHTKVEFDKLIDTALAQCQNNDTDELLESIKKMSAFFKSRHGYLSFFVKQDEIEKIDTDLFNLLAYTKINSLDSVQICLNHIRFMIDHIYQKEIPNLENLF